MKNYAWVVERSYDKIRWEQVDVYPSRRRARREAKAQNMNEALFTVRMKYRVRKYVRVDND